MNTSAPVLTGPVTRAPADPPPLRANALLAVLALAGTVFAMMQALVIPALPRIQVSLGVSADGAAWISTAYLLSACILTPVIGRLGEVSSVHAGAPAASGYVGALILCVAATCAGAFVACAIPRKNHR